MMNMANYVNFETTQTKIKVNQKPGGNSSINLAWDPEPEKKSGIKKNHNGSPNMDNIFNHNKIEPAVRNPGQDNSAKLNNILSHEKYDHPKNNTSNYKNEAITKDLPPREIEYPLIDFDDMVNTPRTKKAIQQEMDRYKALERELNQGKNGIPSNRDYEHDEPEDEEENIYSHKNKPHERKYSEEKTNPGKDLKQKGVLKEKKVSKENELKKPIRSNSLNRAKDVAGKPQAQSKLKGPSFGKGYKERDVKTTAENRRIPVPSSEIKKVNKNVRSSESNVRPPISQDKKGLPPKPVVIQKTDVASPPGFKGKNITELQGDDNQTKFPPRATQAPGGKSQIILGDFEGYKENSYRNNKVIPNKNADVHSFK